MMFLPDSEIGFFFLFVCELLNLTYILTLSGSCGELIMKLGETGSIDL